MGISYQFNENLRQELIILLFYKLAQIQGLKLLSHDIIDEYREFADYKKLQKLVEEYQMKYKKKLKLSD